MIALVCGDLRVGAYGRYPFRCLGRLVKNEVVIQLVCKNVSYLFISFVDVFRTAAIIVVLVSFCMLILFLCELKAFLTPELYSTVAIDSNQDSKVCARCSSIRVQPGAPRYPQLPPSSREWTRHAHR